MSIGYIKLHRKIIDWEWYSDINATRLFFHLLITANFEDKKWRGLEIKRGQQVSSLDNLAKDVNLSKQQLRTSINKLKSTHELETIATRSYTIFTLTNYCAYQDSKTDSNTQLTHQSTNEQQTSNKRATLTKERKERKEEKNIIIPDFIDAELWNNFLKIRLSLKAKNTDAAITILINKLTKFKSRGIDPNICIENSIENSWKGIFEPNKKSLSGNRQSQLDEKIKATNDFLELTGVNQC